MKRIGKVAAHALAALLVAYIIGPWLYNSDAFVNWLNGPSGSRFFSWLFNLFGSIGGEQDEDIAIAFMFGVSLVIAMVIVWATSRLVVQPLLKRRSGR
ncbi:hypothetical protein [Burkholderia guangdongensis]|uniref:hypothetical protein n=1 Tax=Burkholderia guangdongensis TaxID=1792500 RepID=UPI0015C6E2E8|nr:hypothetical protein [Burkholderia guangdongensis]